MNAVTRTQAEAVLTVVKRRYRAHLEDTVLPADESGPEYVMKGLAVEDHPHLVENYDGPGSWGIVWEAGPYEWAYRACSGDINEELAVVYHQEGGLSKDEAGKRAFEPALKLPARVAARVRIEPYYSYVIVVCEA